MSEAGRLLIALAKLMGARIRKDSKAEFLRSRPETFQEYDGIFYSKYSEYRWVVDGDTSWAIPPGEWMNE